MYACLYRPPDHHDHDDHDHDDQLSRAVLSGPPRDDDQRGARRARRENIVENSLEDSACSACSALNVVNPLVAIAQEFSPRYESRDEVVTIDVRGLERLLGEPRTIGEELRRDAARRGVRVHIAVAATRTAALVLAMARPGLTVIDAGGEAQALAPLPIDILSRAALSGPPNGGPERPALHQKQNSAISAISAFSLS